MPPVATQAAPYNAHHAPGGYAPPSQPQYGAPAPQAYGQHGQQEDKGLVATVVGGGAGGALAHKVGNGSKFKTMLGAAGGAMVANAIENKLQGKKPAKHEKHGHHGHHAGQHHHHPQHHGHAGGYSNGGLMGGANGLLGSGSHHGGSSSGSGGLLGSVSGLLGGGKNSYGGGQQHHGHHGGHGHGRW